MKIHLEITKKHLIIPLVILVIIMISYGIFYLVTKIKTQNTNQNLSPALKELPNNYYLFLALKDSFIIPDDYRFDDQILDQKILFFPKSENNINYQGVKSLEGFHGILLSYGSLLKDEKEYKDKCEKILQLFKDKNPASDASGQFMADNISDQEKYIINQTKPYKMIETLLSRKYLIDIISYEDSQAYKKIVESYSSKNLIPVDDMKSILELQQKFSKASQDKDANQVYDLLSQKAKENNNIEKISKIFTELPNEQLKYFTSAGLVYFDGNFIFTSRFQYEKNKMRRVVMTLSVDFDGGKNNWSIGSFSIGQEEKFVPSNPNWEESVGEIKLQQ